MQAQEIAKSVSDAVKIMQEARMHPDVVHMTVLFIPLMHAQRHIQQELQDMLREAVTRG